MPMSIMPKLIGSYELLICSILDNEIWVDSVQLAALQTIQTNP